MGPGTLNIAGPIGSTASATLGSDNAGIAYTESGFATPFINVGPAINPISGAVGGWNISSVGPCGGTAIDLVAQLNSPPGYTGLTGGPYSLLFGKTGATGPTGMGITGPTGPTGPGFNLLRSTPYGSGWLGPTAGGGTGYFVDSFNLGPVTVNNGNATTKVLVSASVQCISANSIKNLSASIFRKSTGMSGTTVSGLNLSIGNTGDVYYPPDNTSSLVLLSSLYTFSTTDPSVTKGPNAVTINMQVIDNYFNVTGYTGPGPWYYAIRVNSESTSQPIEYVNAQLYSIQLT